MGKTWFQRGGLGRGVKAEDVLFEVDAQRLNDLLAGIAPRLAHHTVRRPHLNGADLEQHGHGEVDARRNDAEQHGQRGQPPDDAAAAQHLPGELPLLFALPAGGVPQVRLGGAEPLGIPPRLGVPALGAALAGTDGAFRLLRGRCPARPF